MRLHRVIVILLSCAGAYASGPSVPATQHIAQLRGATQGPVETRDQNQQNSKLVQEVVDSEALLRLNRHEVAEQLGKGEMCVHHELCAKQGFVQDDWYYDVGQGNEDAVGKRPVLILGFDDHGVVDRTYNLRVH